MTKYTKVELTKCREKKNEKQNKNQHIDDRRKSLYDLTDKSKTNLPIK